ncbi:Cytidylate kinase [Pseudodesulfovibrio hydrargyri]|uniref:Cytidylate kinase n=1 Tax=Pseudodesulfovibrio hydrargyri TaxID=2125990 RepID=A0A1J5MWB2_9BACT|nr:cytidylate kinase family protein [Pseudodesulfovibrio hydrargyri]OIQ50108.1 Cytidylate kinase [Pseudodesulfovibrio hydrargyri]
MKKTCKRIFVAIVGLGVMAFGVAFSVKANLGVSPISCIPYVYSLKLDLSLGELTILMNTLFVLAQFLILRKRYTLLHLSQLAAVTVFGFCIDLALYAIDSLSVSTYVWQVLVCLLSCVLIALGVFSLVKAKLTYLPGDGLAVVVSDTFKKEFGKLKVSLDSSMVVIGLASSFVFLHRLEGIREGTVIAALLVGSLVKFYNSRIHWLDAWLGNDVAGMEGLAAVDGALGQHLVVTISREYGSGGHGIGREIAKKLGIDFYDKELINITARESGFTEEYIRQNEQKLAGTLLDELYMQSYAYVQDELPPSDVLFLVQSKIIREIAAKGPCVIVGRCANFVLKDNPNCFNVFIHADEEFRKAKMVNEYGVDASISNKELEKMDRERANYCLEYTGENWRDSTNYHIAINSAAYGNEAEIANKIIGIIPEGILHPQGEPAELKEAA